MYFQDEYTGVYGSNLLIVISLFIFQLSSFDLIPVKLLPTSTPFQNTNQAVRKPAASAGGGGGGAEKAKDTL